MAVPAHDSRDYAFAKHFNLPIIPLIEGADVSEESYDAKEGIMCNSASAKFSLNGLTVKEAIAATKKYVDDNLSVPNYHIVFLNLDGTVDQTSVASTVIHSEIAAHLTNRTQSDYLDVFWDQTRFYAKCVEVIDINTGDLKFIGEIEFNGMQRYIVFTLTPQNVLTTTSIITFESISNKVASVVNYSTNTTKYPTTKAVFDEFQRKPAVIWETDGTGLVGLNTDMSDNPNWQLTNLDFSPFKRVKIYTRAAQKSGTTASASTTPAVVLEMSLDPRAAGPYGGHYIGSYMGQKPNDANRLFIWHSRDE